jgi:hypothetical protein
MFIRTMLNDRPASNITGGQVVEAVKVHDRFSFFSGLLTESIVTSTV